MKSMTKDEKQNESNGGLELSSDDGKDPRISERENDSACSSNGQQGSRGGYSGDCSSSDASSSESSSKQKNQAKSLSDSFQYRSKGKELANAASIDMPSNSLEERGETKTMKELKENTWSNGPGSNVSLQISALSEIIEQNRKMSDIPSIQSQILPQINGVRISHPMDPRIDLQAVDHISGSKFPVAQANTMHLYANNVSEEQAPPPTVDNYLSLMEAVRPFFMSYGLPLQVFPSVPMAQTHLEKEGGSDETNGGNGSSEGFTAFFTTTEKSNSSDSSERKSEAKFPCANAISSRADFPSSLEDKARTPIDDRKHTENESDSSSSSMVVLARIKRKYQRGQRVEGDGDSNESSCRREENPLHDKPNPRKSDNLARHQSSSDINESSSSFSSDRNAVINQGQDFRQNVEQHEGQSHVVSESNNASNTSGSGSGGQSGSNSGTNSGSGSNIGSSGSCNENQGSSGSGNEGKGSSDDAVAKDDTSGAEICHEYTKQDDDCTEKSLHNTTQIGDEHDQEDGFSRENRLLDKKRKRMNMRREYEEQVQQDLDSEESPEEVEIRPGKPVTLDAVLSFTKNPRVIVQATPPFLVVHANAAFSSLTGVDSHVIVGKPIRLVLAIPQTKRDFLVTEVKHSNTSYSGQSSMTNSANGNCLHTEILSQSNVRPSEASMNLENHEAAAAAGKAKANSNDSQDDNIERWITACGDGQFKMLNVVAKPYHMIGRNATLVRGSNRDTNIHDSRNGEHSSEGSSLPSSEAPFNFIICRVGISPVVAGSCALELSCSQLLEDQEATNKRRKQHHTHRRNSKISLVTHYCIHIDKALQNILLGNQPFSHSSPSSKTITNHMSDVQDNIESGHGTENEHSGDNGTETTDPREPIATIG